MAKHPIDPKVRGTHGCMNHVDFRYDCPRCLNIRKRFANLPAGIARDLDEPCGQCPLCFAESHGQCIHKLELRTIPTCNEPTPSPNQTASTPRRPAAAPGGSTAEDSTRTAHFW